jgi:uncharacterized spore protein YtfJ
MNIQLLLETLARQGAAGTSIKNVYGDPVVVGDRTVIPVAQLRYSFGGGGGGPKGDLEPAGGGGGGGVVAAKPRGALEVTPHGTRFISIDDHRTVAIAVAIGFLLGAALMRLTNPRRIEIVTGRR